MQKLTAVVVALLDKVDFKASHDHLVFVGDMIAKGPSSHEVIDLARSLHASCVRGNHEDQLLSAYAQLTHKSPNVYNSSSSQEPLEDESPAVSDKTFAKQYSRKEIDWIAQCPLILSLGPIPGFSSGNSVVVHAGLAPDVPLSEQDPFDAMNMRSIDRATALPSERRDTGLPWWRVWNRAQRKSKRHDRTTVIYGHDSLTGFKRQKYSIGLDSGCVRGGRLSALVIEDGQKTAKKKVISVRCKKYR